MKGTQVGIIHLNDYIIHNDVLFVPNIKFNLISIHKLSADYNFSVHFITDKCIVQVPSMSQLLILGNHTNGLYYILLHN